MAYLNDEICKLSGFLEGISYASKIVFRGLATLTEPECRWLECTSSRIDSSISKFASKHKPRENYHG